MNTFYSIFYKNSILCFLYLLFFFLELFFNRFDLLVGTALLSYILVSKLIGYHRTKGKTKLFKQSLDFYYSRI